jgi:bifunctional oligoribonuclease and PAP phosphatase NrnA
VRAQTEEGNMTIVDTFKARIQAASHIVISTHIMPDADGIGSQISLCLALRKMGKKAICVNDEPLLERYKYLDPQNVVLSVAEYQERYPVDLFIVVDTNTVDRIGPHVMKLVPTNDKILFIDHHPCPFNPDHHHCIDIKAAATGQIVGQLIQGCGLSFDHAMALPLYTSIIIDTSSFRYPSVSSSTHTLVGQLMQTGISPAEAYNGIYGTKKIDHMHLLGTILATAAANPRGDIAWITVSRQMIDKYASDIEDTHAFINHLLVLDKIKVACMFRDDGSTIKMSLRSSGEYDVGVIAKKLGGGGHSHSAATIYNKKPHELSKDAIHFMVSEIEKILDTL